MSEDILDVVKNELDSSQPLYLAFKLALARGDTLDQRTVATLFCYLIGSKLAYLGWEPGPEAHGQLIAILQSDLYPNDQDQLSIAANYIIKVVQYFHDSKRSNLQATDIEGISSPETKT